MSSNDVKRIWQIVGIAMLLVGGTCTGASLTELPVTLPPIATSTRTSTAQRRWPQNGKKLIPLLLGGLMIAIVGCGPVVEKPQVTPVLHENILEATPVESPDVIQQSDEMQADYSELFNKVRANGTVFVIVRLHLSVAFQAEGNLPDNQSVAEQRARITATQDALQRELQDYTIRVYKTYETIPALAMEVNEAALEALISSPLVESIQEDALTN